MKYHDLNEYVKNIVNDDVRGKKNEVPVRREEICNKNCVDDYMAERKIKDIVCHFENVLRQYKDDIDAELEYINGRLNWKDNKSNNCELKEILRHYYDKCDIDRMLPRTAPIKCEDIVDAALHIFDR